MTVKNPNELLPQILYVVPVEERPNSAVGLSPFQQFTIPPGYSSLIGLAVSLPASTFELLQPPHQTAADRAIDCIPRHHIVVCSTPSDFTLLDAQTYSYMCVVQLPGAQLPSHWIKDAAEGRICTITDEIEDFGTAVATARGSLRDYIRRHPDTPKPLRKLLRRRRHQVYVAPVVEHMCSAPNELVLRSIGFKIDGTPIDVWTQDQIASGPDGFWAGNPWHEAVLRSTVEVESARRGLQMRENCLPPGVSLVLLCPQLAPELYEVRFKDSSVAHGLMRLLQKQEGYTIQIKRPLLEADSLVKLFELLEVRIDEIRLVTTLTAVLAARNAAPVVRLPYDLNRTLKLVKTLRQATTSRLNDSGRKAAKVAVAMGKLRAAMRQSVHPAFVERIEGPQSHVKIVCAAPVEWLDVDGMPLMLRHSCSRTPQSPGFLFERLTMDYQLRPIPLRALRRILVLHSFSDDDPARDAFKQTYQVMEHFAPSDADICKNIGFDEAELPSELSTPTELIRREVSSIDDIVTAINGFDGSVVVFDCHGRQKTPTAPNELLIGGRPLSTWDLVGKCRVPHIAILSCCDGHALTGTHASSASGLLAAGATTVLAPVLPISIEHAAHLATNLLFHATRLFPAIIWRRRASIRWSSVVTAIQRMAYAIDVAEGALTRLEAHLPADVQHLLFAEFLRGGLSTTASLNAFLRAVEASLCVEADSVVDAAQAVGVFTETLYYFQFGAPDSLVLDAMPHQ